jgi:hypothetical protein
MNRDTAVAIWYRRIDPRCFTSQDASTPDEDTGPSVFQPSSVAPNTWQPIPDERKRWVLGLLAERLNRGRLAG